MGAEFYSLHLLVQMELNVLPIERMNAGLRTLWDLSNEENQ